MVNEDANIAERKLAWYYAPAATRLGLEALWMLDTTLGQIVRGARDPLIGEMRLTWWYEALGGLDTAPPPPQPVLAALATEVLPHGVTGAELATMIDGWDALLNAGALDRAGLAAHATGRGAALFSAAGRLLGSSGDPLAIAGEGWALADLVTHLSDATERTTAAAAARPLLAEATGRRWSRAGRPLGALAHLARMDLAADPRPPGAPMRVARLLRHRLTGG